MRITHKAIAAGAVLFGTAAIGIFAAEPAWNPSAIGECDRACRSKVEPTTFSLLAADPVQGQVPCRPA